jgi:hypothetical protein
LTAGMTELSQEKVNIPLSIRMPIWIKQLLCALIPYLNAFSTKGINVSGIIEYSPKFLKVHISRKDMFFFAICKKLKRRVLIFLFSLFLHQMLQVGVFLYSFQFLCDNLFHIGFYLIVIVFDNLLNHIVSRFVRKVGDDGDFFVRLCFGGGFRVIDYNLGVENLLFDAFVEIVRNRTNEHALRQI